MADEFPLIDDYKWVSYAGTRVCYLPELDGGGRGFGQDFVRLVRERTGPVQSVFEWCAGPGFIGYSLLAHRLCRHLTLADVNPRATHAAIVTRTVNALRRDVQVYQSDCFDNVPPAKYDLIVGNPPHKPTPGADPGSGPELLHLDLAWRTHRKFLGQAASRLRDDGEIIIVENRRWASSDELVAIIADFPELNLAAIEPAIDTLYYLVIGLAPKGRTQPAT